MSKLTIESKPINEQLKQETIILSNKIITDFPIKSEILLNIESIKSTNGFIIEPINEQHEPKLNLSNELITEIKKIIDSYIKENQQSQDKHIEHIVYKILKKNQQIEMDKIRELKLSKKRKEKEKERNKSCEKRKEKELNKDRKELK